MRLFYLPNKANQIADTRNSDPFRNSLNILVLYVKFAFDIDCFVVVNSILSPSNWSEF